MGAWENVVSDLVICEGCGRRALADELSCPSCGRTLPGAGASATPPGWLSAGADAAPMAPPGWTPQPPARRGLTLVPPPAPAATPPSPTAAPAGDPPQQHRPLLPGRPVPGGATGGDEAEQVDTASSWTLATTPEVGPATAAPSERPSPEWEPGSAVVSDQPGGADHAEPEGRLAAGAAWPTPRSQLDDGVAVFRPSVLRSRLLPSAAPAGEDAAGAAAVNEDADPGRIDMPGGPGWRIRVSAVQAAMAEAQAAALAVPAPATATRRRRAPGWVYWLLVVGILASSAAAALLIAWHVLHR